MFDIEMLRPLNFYLSSHSPTLSWIAARGRTAQARFVRIVEHRFGVSLFESTDDILNAQIAPQAEPTKKAWT